MKHITIYGISNCDKVRAARHWLDNRHIHYHYHDFRKDGVTPALIQSLLAQASTEQLVNTRSTTWKQLNAQQRLQVETEQVIELLCKHPTLIKRPVVQSDAMTIVGFNHNLYLEQFGKTG